jgi:diadenylate cyclase
MKQFYQLLNNVQLADIIDIFIVTNLIYFSLFHLKGTRALNILFGVILALCLYFLSVEFDLYTLQWLLNNLWNYLFVIMVIIFQDQIRSFLALFTSSNSLLLKSNEDETDKVIEEILLSIKRLSKEKIGAIIVIEKKIKLDNFSNLGVRINSEVHADLIGSIFSKTSPLHDGAVIIGGSKIRSAACFLPLSKRMELDKKFGTRHRAALGLSEVSDAIIITVSEANGRINFWHKSIFLYIKSFKNLRIYLNKLLKTDQTLNRIDLLDKEGSIH